MPLTFLNPALLLGLLAAGVPVIIHFLRRRRRRVAFSDLRFLQAAEIRQARRRGIQRWLLLLLRVLIVSCLALAAARPHWGGLPGGGSRAVLFILDASASMQAQAADGRSRFETAVALAGEMLGSLPGETQAQVLVAGAGPHPLYAAWLPAGPPAQATLAQAAVEDGPCDLAGALREAARLIGQAPFSAGEVVLFSDLQIAEEPELEAAAAQLAAVGARLLIRRLGDGVPGGGVLAVELPGRALRPAEIVEIKAVVRPERAEQSFWLELNGRRVAEVTAPPAAEPTAVVTLVFPVVVPGPGLHLGRVGKDPDRLPIDDSRPFVLPVPERLDVLLVHGADRDALGRGGWRYLARALVVDEQEPGPLRLRTVVVDSLLVGDLSGVDLLVWVDAGAFGRRLGGTMREWLGGGGGLLLVAGDPAQVDDLREGILPLLDLPGVAEWRTRPLDQGERARIVDPGHPLLAGLGEQALATLTAGRWLRYFAVAEGESRVILAGDAQAPLLLEGELGAGRWALMPFHLRREATDLMLNPLFLPLVQRLAARLAQGDERALNQAVGQSPVLRLPPASLRLRPQDSAADLEVLVPGAEAPHPVVLTWQGAVPVLAAPPSKRAGFHVFRAAGDTLGIVAAAVPAAESEPRSWAPAELARRLRTAGLERVVDLGAADAAGFNRALVGHDLSRWLLAAALLLLAGELWFGQRVRGAHPPA